MIFMGDMAQLPPVIGCAIRGDKIKSKSTKFLSNLNATLRAREKVKNYTTNICQNHALYLLGIKEIVDCWER